MISILKKGAVVVATALLSSVGFTQEDLSIYTLNNVQQSLYVNPAAKLNHKIHIGLPGVSSVYFDMINNSFNPKHAFNVGSDGTTTIDTDELMKKWKPRNYFGVMARVDLLSFGFTVKEKNYISFSVRENIFSRLTLPGSLLELPIVGNANFEENDGKVDLSGFGNDFSYYRSWALGYQREYNEKWRFGGALKFNQGIANVHFKRSDIVWQTDPNTFDYNFSGQMDVRTSGYDTTGTEPTTKDIISPGNWGLGLDLGAVYQLTDKIELSASLIDLGFITWKKRVNNFRTSEIDVIYDGIDFSDAIFNSDTTDFDPSDQFEEYLEEYEDYYDKYTTSLFTKLYIAGSYQLYKTERTSGKANVLLQGGFYHGKLLPSVTVGYTQNVGNWLQANLNYSYVNRGNNVGLGFTANLFPVQFYVTLDNILASRYTQITDGSDVTIPYIPYNAKKTHVHVGVNLTFGRKDRDKDKDGIKNRKDDCPKTPGLAEFNGCPDTDKDGIKDSEDKCPEIPGLAKFNGCPDTDADGIIDSEDKCPEIAGLEKFNGCPDTDEDGVMDVEDDCPRIAGVIAFKGCPDTDGDGLKDADDACPNNAGPIELNGCPDTDGDSILDYLDNCPEVFGPKENNGCPWPDTDGDGLLDNEDKCPNIAGPVENQGCPEQDTDGDGIPDSEDECPATVGVPENKGCPILLEEVQEIINTAFDNLQFETGKNVIKLSSYESLDRLAELLVEKKKWKLQISGHTDNIGKAQSNLILSKRRAEAVKQYIASKGVDTDRISALFFGETQPIATNDTKEGRQKNRRVEMSIIFD